MRHLHALAAILTLAAGALTALAPGDARAQSAREQPLCDRRTAICEYYPTVGSHVPRAAAHGMRIDLDRRYAELSDADKALLHAQFERMPPGDEPPYPLDGLRPVYQAILVAQDEMRTLHDKILRADEELLLVVDVGADGEPLAVQAVNPRQPELARVVGAVLMMTRYKPARCAGQPCRMGFPFTLGVQTNIRMGPLR